MIVITDGMARPNPSTHYCRICGVVTNDYLLWADGRATYSSCPKHKKKAEKAIKGNGKWACIVGWKKYKEEAQ